MLKINRLRLVEAINTKEAMGRVFTEDLSLTPKKYLEEEMAADKSEYISGQAYAMAGGLSA